MNVGGEPVPAERVGDPSPRVSVVIVVINARRYITEALRLAASRRREFSPGDVPAQFGPPPRVMPGES